MSTRLAAPLLCRDPRCDCWPLTDLSGEAARGTASLRVDAALLDGEPVVRGAAARSFGNAALGERGILCNQAELVFVQNRPCRQIWQLGDKYSTERYPRSQEQTHKPRRGERGRRTWKTTIQVQLG